MFMCILKGPFGLDHVGTVGRALKNNILKINGKYLFLDLFILKLW